ncbi:MAG: FHA domain-containing protein, partial [Parascardovia denticolens]
AYQILFSDGRLIRIDPREGAVIYQIGRSLPEHLPEGVHPMPVDDGTGLISRSHFLLGYSREGVLWVQDLHSSNGTRIVDTLTEERWKVPSESRVRVKPSQRVEFGHSSLTISLEEEPL